ncbi:hypothetical protein LZC95_05180 [Pendulispora brunnea]|uniref:Uncharacterized protein n=1 Tax=Pendulispora brunnea TaxID=2905690 RepID=A0ABZ2KC28_9BACT
MPRILGLLVLLVTTLAARPTRAESNQGGRTFDLGRLVEQSIRFVHDKTHTNDPDASTMADPWRLSFLVTAESLFPSPDPAFRDRFVQLTAFGATLTPHRARHFGIPRPAVRVSELPLGDSVQVSLVARDWNGSVSIFGRGALLTDHYPLTRSSRVLVGRLSAQVGPFVPFVHVGAGTWRFDPNLMPLFPRQQEFAVQFSAGLAMHLTPRVSFACEVDHMMLAVETRDHHTAFDPHIIASFAVLQIAR